MYRRVAASSPIASFASEVSPRVSEELRLAETAGLRGDLDSALHRLRALAESLPPGADDDRVAVGELALVAGAWAGRLVEMQGFVETLAESVTSADARGALLFARGRLTRSRQSTDYLTRALGEFTLAGDDRGRAVTMGELCWLRNDGMSPEYRVELGQEALELAETIGDPWAVAFCAGRIAATETYLDRPEARDRWIRATTALRPGADSLTSEILSLNQHNRALTAWQHGDYALASTVTSEAKVLARGPTWSRKFGGVRALVAWRTGNLGAVEETALSTRVAASDELEPLAAIALGAGQLERQGRVSSAVVDDALDRIFLDEQMSWQALAVQADIRAIRNEPRPLRALPTVVDQVCDLGARFGWEDVVLVMARHQLDLARAAMSRLEPLWPSYPRGRLVHEFVAGLLAETRGFDRLCAAAQGFEELGEPVTAGQAWHAAARVAHTVSDGNRLLERAVDLLERSGAERSLAAVLRERRLHRRPGHNQVPESQRFATTAALTTREREVAELAARGLTTQEIADELHISRSTANHHVLKVRQKLGGVPKRKLAEILGQRS